MAEATVMALEPKMLLLTLIALSVAVLADADVSPIHSLLGFHDDSNVANNLNHTLSSHHHLIPHVKMPPKLIVAKPNVGIAGKYKPKLKGAQKHKPNVKFVPKHKLGPKAHPSLIVRRLQKNQPIKLKPKLKISPKVILGLNHTIPKPKPKISPKITPGLKPKTTHKPKLTPKTTLKPKLTPKTTLKPKVNPKTTRPPQSNRTTTVKPRPTKKPNKKPTKPRGHWPECTIYSGKRFRKVEWGKLYNALALVLEKEKYPPKRMEVWSACKQVSPGTHLEKWITAFWDTKTPNAHSCSAEFSHDPVTGKLKLTAGPACHVESVDLCVSQMKSITKCKYPYIL